MVVLLSSACREAGPAAGADGDAETGEASSDGGSADSSSGEPPIDVPEGCGNGIVEADEECDLGFANAADGACTPTCTLPRCGDGLRSEGEACDEGEANGGPTCSEACARPTRLRWSTTVGGSVHQWDTAVAVVPVGEASAVVAHYIDEDPWQVVISRYDADGTRPWSTTLASDPLRYYGLGTHLVPTGDDGVLLSIFADVADVEGSERVELRRLDAGGQTLWHHVVVAGAQGRPLGGRVTRAGEEIVLTVVIEVESGQLDTLVTRLDDDGVVLGERMVEESLWRTAGAPDGGFFAHDDMRLLAYGSDDVLAWSIVAASTSSPNLVVDAEGRPLVTRRAPSDDRLLEAYTADGRLRWQTLLEVSPGALAMAPSGELAIAGIAAADPLGLPTNVDLGVETFDAEGTRRWIERIDGPAHAEDAGEAVAITADGAVWVVGDVSVPFEEHDAWIGRFEEAPR